MRERLDHFDVVFLSGINRFASDFGSIQDALASYTSRCIENVFSVHNRKVSEKARELLKGYGVDETVVDRFGAPGDDPDEDPAVLHFGWVMAGRLFRKAASAIQEVRGHINRRLIARAEEIDSALTAVLSREHVLLLGPPGTAKSMLINTLASYFSPWTRDGRPKVVIDADSGDYVPAVPVDDFPRELFEPKVFTWLMTAFTTPDELFGPIDIKEFMDNSSVIRKLDGKLAKAHLAYLDEIWKANSAILNALLTLINERLFDNGTKREKVPLITMFGSSNEYPADSSLQAMFDRFLFKHWVEYLDEEEDQKRLIRMGFPHVEQEQIGDEDEFPFVTLPEIEFLYHIVSSPSIFAIQGKMPNPYSLLPPNDPNVSGLIDTILEAVNRVRDEGVAVSDRVVTKLPKVLAAYAIVSTGRPDLSRKSGQILKNILWNKEDQRDAVSEIIDDLFADKTDAIRAQVLSDVKGLYAKLRDVLSEISDGSESIADLVSDPQWVADPMVRQDIIRMLDTTLAETPVDQPAVFSKLFPILSESGTIKTHAMDAAARYAIPASEVSSMWNSIFNEYIRPVSDIAIAVNNAQILLSQTADRGDAVLHAPEIATLSDALERLASAWQKLQ